MEMTFGGYQRSMCQADVCAMMRRRAKDAGIETKIGSNTFRTSGITEYLKNGGKLEVAQHMDNHGAWPITRTPAPAPPVSTTAETT
jgi:site-specific recombinase XerD